MQADLDNPGEISPSLPGSFDSAGQFWLNEVVYKWNFSHLYQNSWFTQGNMYTYKETAK